MKTSWNFIFIIFGLNIKGLLQAQSIKVFIPDEVIIGEDVTLKCNYELGKAGFDKVKWFKNGKLVFTVDENNGKVEGNKQDFDWKTIDVGKSNKNVLKLNGLKDSATGEYKCVVYTKDKKELTAKKIMRIVSFRAVYALSEEKFYCKEQINIVCTVLPSNVEISLYCFLFTDDNPEDQTLVEGTSVTTSNVYEIHLEGKELCKKHKPPVKIRLRCIANRDDGQGKVEKVIDFYLREGTRKSSLAVTANINFILFSLSLIIKYYVVCL